MKKHWIEYLPYHPDMIEFKQLLDRYNDKIRNLQMEMHICTTSHKDAIRVSENKAAELFTEDEITAAIGKAMTDEINQGQNYTGQSITFTNL